MSAQAGIWNIDGKPVDAALLQGFSELLSCQAPDGCSSHLGTGFAMLYRPFHTTVESRKEVQPHNTRNGFVLTWDGRLDNREQLAQDLGLVLTDAMGDVAICAAAFDRWGTDCFRRIIGDWAVSIWKPVERELILAVDYMAIRHLFYYQTPSELWWSTDPTPIVLLAGGKLHVDDEYVAEYFTATPTNARLTPFREISAVPPGSFVRFQNGVPAANRYWSFDPEIQIRYRSDAEYEEQFRVLFRQAVRRRLRSDSPILAELSGGLDSSSVVCLADDIVASGGASCPQIDTLSFFDKTEPTGDDWFYFDIVEKRRGRVGTHIDGSIQGTSPAPLEYPSFVVVPGYVGDGRNLEAQRSAVVQNGGYRAVLSGRGGDEFMGGIPDPSPQIADVIVQLKLSDLIRLLNAWSLAKRKPWMQLLWRAWLECLPARISYALGNRTPIEPWIVSDFAKRTNLSRRRMGLCGLDSRALPTSRSSFSALAVMATKMSRRLAGEATPEETRFPFLDQDLIRFVISIPPSQLLRPGERRSLMRRALAGYVPSTILDRRTKSVGARTMIIALDKNWDELQQLFSSPTAASASYLNTVPLLEAVQSARAGKSVHIFYLLKAISLHLWLKDLQKRRLIEVPACVT
jgi:asparagine synthase (glutamine-hydrolysing)